MKRWIAALATLWLFGGTADASIDRKSGAVLERYQMATGGAAAWERDSTVHARMRLQAFGMTGSVDRWMARPDRSRTATRIGTLSLSEGTSGGRAWRIDQNGKLQWLDGPELADALGAVYLDQEMWLAPNQGGGTVRYLTRETADGMTHDVLEVTPPKGKPKRLSFDTQSGFLVKVRQPGDRAQTIVTILSEYADISGRQRAQRTVSSVEGTPANDVDATLDSVRAQVEVEPSLFLPPTAVSKDFRFLGGGSSVTVPMRYSERHVWVKVSVNGAPAEDFLLDTGASVTVIDSAFAARLGLASQGSMQGSGRGSEGRFAFSRLQTLRVESGKKGVELTGQNVVVAALSPYLAAYFWRDTPGILGYDFLSRFVTTVDYEGQTLTIADPGTFTYQGKGKAIPMSLSNGVPVVHGKLDDQYEGDFRLDVGSGSSVDLHTFYVEKTISSEVTRKVETQGAGFGGSIAIAMARMKTFAIGPYVVADPLVGLSRVTSGAFASKDFAGNIGNRILDRFRTTLDYSRKTVYLESNRRFGDREPFGKFGAQLLRDGDRVIIGYVQDGTPAARAGIVRGDVLVSVDGREAAKESVADLSRRLEDAPDGTELELKLERGGKAREIKVKLESIL